MSDLFFSGGKTGICKCYPSQQGNFIGVTVVGKNKEADTVSDGGNQQFTAQRLEFLNVKTAVEMLWDWGWVSVSAKQTTHVLYWEQAKLTCMI